MQRDDLTCRRLAVQLACQLPPDKNDCLRVLEHLRALIEFTTGSDDKIGSVTKLRPVK
jgi:hypothetical protein